jgi:hypothetical protein
MFGSITGVFASRWKALWWSVGILVTAYCSVPSADETAQTNADQAKSVKASKDTVDALGVLNNPPSQD